MQDVSCEPLMLCLSENPQASLDIFVSYIITLQGLCIHRKAINKNKPSYPLDGILLQERLPHARKNGLFLFIALERMAAFILMKVLICF